MTKAHWGENLEAQTCHAARMNGLRCAMAHSNDAKRTWRQDVCPRSTCKKLDGVPDIANLNIGRKRHVTKIIAGYKSLTDEGAVQDEWLQKTLPKMTKAMELWGALQRQTEVPDKVSKTLIKDASAFAKAAKTKDYTATLKAFDVYMADLPDNGPGGSGKIDLSDAMVPPPEDGK
eukprot:CAMPEP_0198528070 /NCGR_PEP_ID=MMETSP1462-20131121/24923_1 /TAXON_ID=1333877 /ORGANISM="Brandtodinium nutriculum, Strain RCC3387" /LENGTH=174 /DNA_ID=CAMNT_0044257887 /DNA_START=574 /DNA_END=1095 /DNA_ORIENTATION=+